MSPEQNMEQMRDLLARLLTRVEELGADPLDELARACKASIAARPSPDLLHQAVEALEPFAAAAREIENDIADSDIEIVSVGDLRRARTVLSALTAHKESTK